MTRPVRYDRRQHPTLRRGARSDDVVKLQRRLVAHFPDLDGHRIVDGIFGPMTERQVRRFQEKEHLQVDGVVGRDTWSALLRDPTERSVHQVGRTGAQADRRQVADQASTMNGGGQLAERAKRALQRKGYVFLDDSKSYHLNIVGVRGFVDLQMRSTVSTTR